jgi:hypothetical protein
VSASPWVGCSHGHEDVRLFGKAKGRAVSPVS